MTPTHSPQKRSARALWYVDRGLVALHEEDLVPHINASDVRVETLYSGISRGTERLVFLGAVPETERESMRAPLQVGAFPFPVKYGYCAVGIIREGPDNLRERVAFCLHPHQDQFVVPASTIQVVPDGIPAKRATLAGNMETALNAHWDAGTRMGDRVNVIGGGILGLLTAYLAARIPGTEVTLVDVSDKRKPLADHIGVAFANPSAVPDDADVIFHTSASAPGLQTALDSAAMEARIVEMSWYGAREVGVSLGGAFHSKRLQLISTQVGHVAGANRPRWNFKRRLAKAITLLADPVLDALVQDEIAFDDVERRLPAVFSDNASRLPPVLRYPAADRPA